ncbi:histidine phosphatase family protein [Actinotalea sp.]|uniref:SixA phosphatase family protein n=1 Tax=Actinotalea sp. TaxID=1872145 RepID=UPI00356B4911
MTGGRPAGHRLVLLRHAKAESHGDRADELRALALAGRRQSGDVGLRLVTSGLLPERVLVSSAVRARQTWDLVRSSLGDVPDPEVDVSDELYDAGPRGVIELMATVDERIATLLVVGHEPTMSMTGALLADVHGSSAGLATLHTGLPTAGFAVLDVPSWSAIGPSACRLLEVWRPER